MTILITGGAGFIGSTLAGRLLKEGHEIVIVDNFSDYYDPKIKHQNIEGYQNNPHFHLEIVDITNLQKLDAVFKNYPIDAVVHLAARAGVRPSLEDPIAYQKTNCGGTNNLLECARKYHVHNLILASSSSVYGNNKSLPFKETDCVDFAISPYAATKKANEVLAHVYHAIFGMNIILFRFFTVYGPRQRPDLAINKFIQAIHNNKQITLFGDGTTFRDYTFVDDICDGIIAGLSYLISHENVYEIINLGSNHPISLIEMVHVIETEMNKKADIAFLPMQPGDVQGTYADINKARMLLGFQPKVSFKDGIKRYLQWLSF